MILFLEYGAKADVCVGIYHCIKHSVYREGPKCSGLYCVSNALRMLPHERVYLETRMRSRGAKYLPGEGEKLESRPDFIPSTFEAQQGLTARHDRDSF